MRISKIGLQTNFAGDRTEKTKKALRNTAGAAAIAVAASLPVDETEAQNFYPLPMPVPPAAYYYNPPSALNIPNCFIYGDIKNFDYAKSLRETFDEIDSQGNENGVLSVSEVVEAERENWNATHLYPYNANQLNYTVNSFNVLSRMYNEEDSNPRTINFREYKKIMRDYMQARNVNNFFNLLRIFSAPSIICPPPHRLPHPHPHPGRPPHPPHRHR